MKIIYIKGAVPLTENGKRTNKIVVLQKSNDNNNHNLNNDNKIEIRLELYQINFLLIVLWKEKEKRDTGKSGGRYYLNLWYSALEENAFT